MTRLDRLVAETERRLATFNYDHLYKAGARLARTGGGYTAKRYSRENGLDRQQTLAVEDGFKAEMSKPAAQRRGRLG